MSATPPFGSLSSEPKHFPLERLPDAPISHILSWLSSAQEINRAGTTCKRIQALIQWRTVWQGEAAQTLFRQTFQRLQTIPLNLFQIIRNAGKVAWNPHILGPETWELACEKISDVPPIPWEQVEQAKKELLKAQPTSQPILFLAPPEKNLSNLEETYRRATGKGYQYCLGWMDENHSAEKNQLKQISTGDTPRWCLGALIPGSGNLKYNSQESLVHNIGQSWEVASAPLVMTMEAGTQIKTGKSFLGDFSAHCPELTPEGWHLAILASLMDSGFRRPRVNYNNIESAYGRVVAVQKF